MTYTFPFGEPVQTVQQADRSPKQAFVLGVYASAVHARWIGPSGRPLVRALAVASEPEIFWRGDGADAIIARIAVPADMGSLTQADPQLNGPSGRTLDDLFLQPLGLTRADVWLADLLPESRVGTSQAKALMRAYQPFVEAGIAPPTDVPLRPGKGFLTAQRRAVITDELVASQASLLITLGNEPIREYLRAFGQAPMLRSDKPYGTRRRITIQGRDLDWLPLVHPRQAARLGTSSKIWGDLHRDWMSSL